MINKYIMISWLNNLKYNVYSLLIFVSIVYQSAISGQADMNAFNTSADKVNLKIAMALLAEKRRDTSELSEGLSYEEFITKIKYPENKKIAQDINEFKKEISSSSNAGILVDMLDQLIKRSISNIPNQNDSIRKKTIKGLHIEFSEMLEEIKNKSSNQDIADIESVNDIEDNHVESEDFDYKLWLSIIIILILSIYNLVKLSIIHKDFRHFQTRYNQFEDIQKAINQEYSEKQLNVPLQRKTEAFHFSDSDVERIKRIIVEEVQRAIREEVHFNSNSVTKELLMDQSPAKGELNSEKTILKFIEAPEREGYFDKNFLSNSETPKSLYKIIIYPDSNKIEYDLLADKTLIHRNAMDHPHNMLKPACDYVEDPKPYDKKIIKVTSDKGTLEEDNGKLIIIDKLKIKFG